MRFLRLKELDLKTAPWEVKDGETSEKGVQGPGGRGPVASPHPVDLLFCQLRVSLVYSSWIQFGRGKCVFLSEEYPAGGVQAALFSAWAPE